MAQTSINKVNNSILDKYLPKLFEHYPLIDLKDTTVWLAWGNDTPPKVEKYVCHANLSWQKPGLSDLVCGIPNNDEISLAYQRMLIGGPFRGFSDLITLGSRDGQYYSHCSNLDQWPANALYNYCIATRVPIEHQRLLPYWFDLCKEGYDPTLAFLLSWSKVGNKDGYRSFPSLSHFWFDASSSWKNILKGEMSRLSESYAKNPIAVRPCNIIWGNSLEYVDIGKLTDEEVANMFGLQIIKPDSIKKASKPFKMAFDVGHEAVNAAFAALHAGQAQPPIPAWQFAQVQEVPEDIDDFDDLQEFDDFPEDNEDEDDDEDNGF